MFTVKSLNRTSKSNVFLAGALIVMAMLVSACAAPAVQATDAPPAAETTEVVSEPTATEAAPTATEPVETEAALPETGGESAPTPSVRVADQAIDNGMVTVPEVTSNGPGWIVIHADAGGGPGPVVGYAAVVDGVNGDVQVEIDETTATETLYAMLHTDAGTVGEYEFPGDDGPVKVDDQVVVKPFTVEGLAAEELTPAVLVDDQEIEGGTVTVSEVDSNGPGWIVIHADADGGPGPVIGFAAVTDGSNENVQVEVDETAATGTLYAMLHTDAGTVGEYEFPGDDGPVQVDGQVVMEPLMVEGSKPDDNSSMQKDAAVTIVDRAFQPAQLTVTAGTTVVWTHSGSLPHTVTADDGSFTSGTLNSGDVFQFTFDQPGEYAYHCEFHGGPGGQGMSGVITVTAGDNSSGASGGVMDDNSGSNDDSGSDDNSGGGYGSNY